MKGLAYLTAAVLVVIAIGVGVSASTWHQVPAQFQNKLTQFNNQSLRFEYPSSWTAKTYQEVSSFTYAVVFFSNREMHAPCVTHDDSGGNSSTTCSAAVSRLGYDGVLVEWTANGFPGWTLAKEPGLPISVNGRPAKESVVSKHPSCVSDTQQDVTVVIARTVEWNYYEMNACLSGPDLDAERSQVQAMIASTKILQP